MCIVFHRETQVFQITCMLRITLEDDLVDRRGLESDCVCARELIMITTS